MYEYIYIYMMCVYSCLYIYIYIYNIIVFLLCVYLCIYIYMIYIYILLKPCPENSNKKKNCGGLYLFKTGLRLFNLKNTGRKQKNEFGVFNMFFLSKRNTSTKMGCDPQLLTFVLFSTGCLNHKAERVGLVKKKCQGDWAGTCPRKTGISFI